MVSFPIENLKNQVVGHVENDVYYTTRDWNKGQVFHHPKYEQGVGLDMSILERLRNGGVTILCYLITGLEDYAFHAVISVSDFERLGFVRHFGKIRDRNGVKTGWGEQRICSLKNFTRFTGEVSKKNILLALQYNAHSKEGQNTLLDEAQPPVLGGSATPMMEAFRR